MCFVCCSLKQEDYYCKNCEEFKNWNRLFFIFEFILGKRERNKNSLAKMSTKTATAKFLKITKYLKSKVNLFSFYFNFVFYIFHRSPKYIHIRLIKRPNTNKRTNNKTILPLFVDHCDFF